MFCHSWTHINNTTAERSTAHYNGYDSSFLPLSSLQCKRTGSLLPALIEVGPETPSMDAARKYGMISS